jgi:transposase-like protein
MEDYPRDHAEFESRFSTEAACEAYLLRLRWPDGFVCPRCSGRQGWVTQRGLVVCKDCGYQSSLRAGTIFEGSHKPLGLWFRAMWYVTGAKNGASAVTVQRVLGLGSYQTAWTWLHKLRRAMVTPGRERLRGEVEVDETFLGAPEEGRHGRRMLRKTMVVVAAERKTAGIGRIRMRRIPDGKAKSLHPFVLDGIEPGSVLHTDDWQGYAGLEAKGYQRQSTNIARSGETASQVLPGVHRVVSLLKRWLMGTHQGAVSHEHLDYYLDEFTFRFNRRTSRSRGKLFCRLMQNAVRVPPTPYQRLIQGVRGRTSRGDHNILC